MKDEKLVVKNPEAGFIVEGFQDLRNALKAMGKKTCLDCVFCQLREKTIEKPSFSALFGLPENDIRIHLVCRKFLLDLNDKLESAVQCSSFLTEKEYHEKALRGEIVGYAGIDKNKISSTPEPIMTTCQYCGAKYDITLYQRCPKCGAYPQ